ncbi:hypothetical protein CCE01nite_12000 [Cellulomonas cellasea]|uniref:Uncharacterized protein n=1 Tax=Cellulomonas cellasea TaxID=43670 RepID=A0A4Y3KS43_9CELL|nr:hypothetical protein CCE01nite_12000 [Cellulomonas cellasea]
MLPARRPKSGRGDEVDSDNAHANHPREVSARPTIRVRSSAVKTEHGGGPWWGARAEGPSARSGPPVSPD